MFLSSIDATSASDVWVAGTRQVAARTYRGFLTHWDGSSWTSVDTSRLAHNFLFNDVSVLEPTNAWVAGTVVQRTGNSVMLARWNGTTIRAKAAILGDLVALGVEAIAQNDVWAVGGETTEDHESVSSYTAHWDGASLTEILTPDPVTPGYESQARGLRDVSASATDDVWAVGTHIAYTYPDFPDTPPRSVDMIAFHWDGSAWTAATMPNSANAEEELFGVDLLPDGSGWAVGSSENAGSDLHSGLVLHLC
jgi:hypothetical protein